ncbi:MAG: ornithine carbamoyltransferase [Sphingomonadaceae bacterium]
MNHLLDLAGLPPGTARAILDEAHRRKAARAGRPRGATDDDRPLAGHHLAMIFEKNSTRTRVSFEMAMRQLGGTASVLTAADLQLGRGESVEDTARVIGRYVDCVMLRARRHADLQAFAAHAGVPVINGLTERTHPCQALADAMTIEERLGRPVAGTRWAWVGDGNNMARALAEAAQALGFALAVAAPEGWDGGLATTRSPREAVAGADVVVTDVWFSMGDADDAAKRAALADFAVTPELMAMAAPHALFLHCLPAHRGEEVAAEVIDGPASAVWDEAENRLHVQKAILLWALGRL